MRLILLFILLFSVPLLAQKKNWDPAVLKKANTARDAEYLSKEEKAVIYYLNLVRLDPKLFAETYLKKYLDSTGDNNTYTKSLIKTLPLVKPMDVLMPGQELCSFSKAYAIKSGKENTVGHGNFNQRIKVIKNQYNGYLAENCDYGNKKAFDIVMSLLIDEDIPSLGHRKNILNPKYRFVGVSIKPHKGYEWNCVIDFAG
jgi:uncharacterized protein YkwD